MAINTVSEVVCNCGIFCLRSQFTWPVLGGDLVFCLRQQNILGWTLFVVLSLCVLRLTCEQSSCVYDLFVHRLCTCGRTLLSTVSDQMGPTDGEFRSHRLCPDFILNTCMKKRLLSKVVHQVCSGTALLQSVIFDHTIGYLSGTHISHYIVEIITQQWDFLAGF